MDEQNDVIDGHSIYGEPGYLNLGRNILNKGVYRQEGNEFGRYELFAQPLKFNLLGNVLPLLTTKRVFFRGLAYEMLFFIGGETNIKFLKKNGINIWDIWADENDEIGPLYGHQWNHWRVDPKLRPYIGSDEINQLSKTMKSLRDRPKARSHVITAWRPDHIPAMSIKPCHMLLQFYRAPLTLNQRLAHMSGVMTKDDYEDAVLGVQERKNESDEQVHSFLDKKEIPRDGVSLQMTQRSCDFYLGVPFNIGQYALLCSMVSHQLGCAPVEFTIMLNDVHIYENHVEHIKTQLDRELRPQPQLFFNRLPNSIYDYTFKDFRLVGYNPHPKLPKGDVSEQGKPGNNLDLSKLEEHPPFDKN